MIWVFDSWSWWLTFLENAKKICDWYDFLYFGDFKNCPYGNKSFEEIFSLTKSWVLKLKNAWAQIVILACNTATSCAIRKLQSQEKEIGVKVLWVTIPWAEKIIEQWYKKVTVFATKFSIDNKLYKTRVKILDENIKVQEIWFEKLAEMIEEFLQWKSTKQALKKYISSNLEKVWEDSWAIVLGCTHYSHIIDIFSEIFPDKEIVCPSLEAAKKLKIYLKNHPEIETKLSKNWKTMFLP